MAGFYLSLYCEFILVIYYVFESTLFYCSFDSSPVCALSEKKLFFPDPINGYLDDYGIINGDYKSIFICCYWDIIFERGAFLGDTPLINVLV